MSDKANESKGASTERIFEALRGLRKPAEPKLVTLLDNEDPKRALRRAGQKASYDAGIAVDYNDHS